MNNNQLLTLLQRFMDGTTTIDEETLLADFFRHATASDRPDGMSAADWDAYRQMFAMFEADAKAGAAKVEEPSAVRRQRLRVWRGRVAAAAVLLLVAGGLTMLTRNNGNADGGNAQPTLAQHAANVLSPDSFADSISAEQPRRIVSDSLRNEDRKKPSHKRVRPYWQPRPPKVYMAEAAPTDAASKPVDEPDSRQIDEAVRQAEMLLKAINLQQTVELKQLELQAMDDYMGADDTVSDDADDTNDTNNNN